MYLPIASVTTVHTIKRNPPCWSHRLKSYISQNTTAHQLLFREFQLNLVLFHRGSQMHTKIEPKTVKNFSILKVPWIDCTSKVKLISLHHLSYCRKLKRQDVLKQLWFVSLIHSRMSFLFSSECIQSGFAIFSSTLKSSSKTRGECFPPFLRMTCYGKNLPNVTRLLRQWQKAAKIGTIAFLLLCCRKAKSPVFSSKAPWRPFPSFYL